MAELTFRHGEYETVPYTPSAGDIAEGELVLLGNTTGLTCGIAWQDLTNNVAGTLAVGAIWETTNLNNSANYAKVYWDNSVNRATSVSTNNALLGYVWTDGAGGVNSAVKIKHHPFA
jgi:predicted RecA/RadA family phage recombinase